MPGAAEAEHFPYHRGLAPMLWVLFGLSIVEIGVVHLLVTLLWPVVGWTLTIVSVIAAVWLVIFIRSLPRLPHVLEGGVLRMRLGRIKEIALERERIECISAHWESGGEKARDALNLAAIAYPNRCVRLREPLPSGKARVFIKLDDPAAFDAAMRAWGVVPCSD